MTDYVINGSAGTAPPSTSGLDAARPAAGTSGARFTATDTGAVYLDDGAAWHPLGVDIVTTQGWSDAAYLSGGTGAAVGPAGGPGWSFAACLYVGTLPGAFRSYATYSQDADARGWVLAFGQNTANALSLGHVQAGPTNIIVETGVITTGWHKVAFAIAADGLSAQWSLDGSSAATATIALTSYVAPNAACVFDLGRFSYAGYPAPSDCGVAAIAIHHAVLTGAQLAAITAAPSDGRLLTPAGVSEDFAWRAALQTLPVAGTYTSGGVTPRTLTPMGAVRTVVR